MRNLYIVPIADDGSLGKMLLAKDTWWSKGVGRNTGRRLLVQVMNLDNIVGNDKVAFICRMDGFTPLWEVSLTSDGISFASDDNEPISSDGFFQWLLNNYPKDHTFMMFNLDILSGRFSPGEDCEEVVL